jgi:uncharacterized membrane protein YagU involved in acid resistance
LKQNFWRTILLAGLLVGSLDIIAAIVNFYSKTGKNPQIVLKYIASAVVGKEAFSGGMEMSALGLAIHFLIAFVWTIIFFIIRPVTISPIVTGIVYGIFIWALMSLAVLPMTKVAGETINIKDAITAALILIGAIGLPLSFIAHRFYKRKA